MGVSGDVSPGEAAEPRLSSGFSSATFRAPLTSAIPAFPSLLARGLLTVPFPPGAGFCGLRGGLRARAPRLAGAPSGSLALPARGFPATAPSRPPAPGWRGRRSARQLRLPRWRRRSPSRRLPPYITRQLIIIEAARLNPFPAGRARACWGRARRWHRPLQPAPGPLPRPPQLPPPPAVNKGEVRLASRGPPSARPEPSSARTRRPP